jgi:hypothetical protein
MGSRPMIPSAGDPLGMGGYGYRNQREEMDALVDMYLKACDAILEGKPMPEGFTGWSDTKFQQVLIRRSQENAPRLAKLKDSATRWDGMKELFAQIGGAVRA